MVASAARSDCGAGARVARGSVHLSAKEVLPSCQKQGLLV